MQLLCRYDVNDFASWKEHFDADTEAQRDAGLSLLQIWQEHDTPSRVFCLFEVNDLDKARPVRDRRRPGRGLPHPGYAMRIAPAAPAPQAPLASDLLRGLSPARPQEAPGQARGALCP